ncbi:hypothetical protein A9Q95_14340 [Rhodobacterales bacterium 59_46_T64]|nr:hypothetical protein A9Q95_14340 [Rhodobacterales bacterium 59_46_T64]
MPPEPAGRLDQAIGGFGHIEGDALTSGRRQLARDAAQQTARRTAAWREGIIAFRRWDDKCELWPSCIP